MMEDKGIEPVPISVNVSRMHVYQEKFTENLKNMAGEYGIDPKYIPLEITEVRLLRKRAVFLRRFSHCRDMALSSQWTISVRDILLLEC